MTAARAAMPLRETLAVLRAARADGNVVVTSMGTAREWMAMGPLHARDFVFVPSSMGQAPSLALGLALAQPARRVVACSGDGSMLMSLGVLATITAEAPANLVLLVFDNGVYEVTGAQPTPGSALGRRDARDVDFAAMARACGFGAVYRFSDLDEWRARVGEVLSATGPTFVVLDVAPVPGAVGPRSPGPTPERARRFMEALRAG